MSYQVLARKYRSQSFDQMIGQDHISQTLLNALKHQRLPHALLFTGIRGTGKTSSARILAKSIRCQNAVDFVPCGRCTDCVEIAAGRSMDVIEIDGASNNGVDNIRELRDSVAFSSSTGKYKIFIIDEVHMLSSSAFNALLKTLEEPPAHVVFIMATTEVQKIPQTILSRCQRFDFRRVTIKDLSKHLKWICSQENIKIDDKAVWLIARQGEGSVRDSLSLLDQVINFSQALSGEEITSETVSQILGLTDRSLVISTFESILQRDADVLLKNLEKINQTAFNAVLFIEDLLRLFRHSIFLKSAGADAAETHQIDLPKEEIEYLQKQIENISLSDLHSLFDMSLKALNDVSKAYDQMLVLEVSMLRIVQSPQVKDIMQLLQGGISSSAATASVPPIARPTTPKSSEGLVRAPTPQSRVKPTEPAHLPPQASNTNASVSVAKPSVATWFGFVQKIKQDNPFLGAKVEHLVFTECDEENSCIQLQVEEAFAFVVEQIKQAEVSNILQGFIDSFFGRRYTLKVTKAKQVSGDSAARYEQRKEQEILEKKEQAWLQDTRIKKAQQVFNGKARLITK